MQILGEGRDKVELEYAYQDLLLFRTVSGSFQYGTGKDAKIVVDEKEVDMFPEDVKGQVREWLRLHGPQRAMQEKIQADIHEQSMSEPGSLDARLGLLEKVSPGLKGEVQALLDALLVKHGLVGAASDIPSATAPPPAGRYRVATPDEIRTMQKSGLPVDPTNPPKVWDPEGELAGPASALRDVPEVTSEMDSVRNGIKLPSAEDLLREEDDALKVADELAEDLEDVRT